MDVKSLITEYLKENNLDGLYDDESGEACGCGLDNLIPCGMFSETCQPAIKKEDGLFHPSESKKQRPTYGEIVNKAREIRAYAHIAKIEYHEGWIDWLTKLLNWVKDYNRR